MKYRACIQIISSRKACLKHCLQNLFQFYNHRYNYPVFIHYFDDIYDCPKYRKMIHTEISPNIHFVSVPYNTPGHIKEEELFYNRTQLKYVKKSFPIKRKGYLHMCHFKCNFYEYPSTCLHKYDYIIVHDDEAGYVKKPPFDPVKVMADRPEDIGAYIVGQRLKNGKPHQGHLDSRIGLWAFIKDFLLSNGIKPKSQLLKKLMTDKNAEWNLHFLPWADTYVLKTKIYRTDLWKKWMAAVNQNGGLYKFCWGDNEIMSLFHLIFKGVPIYNLRLVEKGCYDQGLFRKMQDKAPGVKYSHL